MHMTVATFPGSRLTLGYLCPHNPHDRRAFSGTSHFAAAALARQPGVTLRILGSHRQRGVLNRLMGRAIPKMAGGEFDLSGLDAVIGVVATPLLAALQKMRPDLPTYHVTDATPTFLREAYGWSLPRTAYELEHRVAGAATAVIYSSKEMAARAPYDLGLPDLSPLACPFGVNADALPADCPVKPPLSPLRLLFVGLDWERKGGDIAVATLDRLREQGIEAELTVVGRCPDRCRRHPAVRCAGFLSMNRDADRRALTRLYRQSHLLLVPSRADCTPMVIAEAMAFGTPALATDTGGIASVIGAGRLLEPHASPGRWAAEIRSITQDPDHYAFLSDACFERRRATISWDNWAREIVALRAELPETGTLDAA